MSTYTPLATIVSHLEMMVEVMGEGRRELVAACEGRESRESLRERFRRLVRMLQRLEVENDVARKAWSILAWSQHSRLPDGWELLPSDLRPSAQPDNVFTRTARAKDEPRAEGWPAPYSALSRPIGYCDVPAPVPFFIKTSAALDFAIRAGRDGITAVFVAFMDLWSRRHDIPQPDAAAKQATRLRRSRDRLYMALMRFVFGFFGSHKVDGRNNP